MVADEPGLVGDSHSFPDLGSLSVPGSLGRFFAEDRSGGAEATRSISFFRAHPSLLVDLEDALVEVPRISDDPSGTIFGRYQAEALVGRGGSAEVYRATDTETGDPVALKLSRPELPESRELILREGRTLAGIQHPNIVPALGAGEAHGRSWIAMAWVEGRTLEDPITDTRVARADQDGSLRRSEEELREILRCFLEFAGALGHLHRAGLVHRDVKPRNLLIRADGVPIVIDLGLAAPTIDAKPEGWQLAGTIPYMSPEQTLGGFAAVGVASDIYSLAATMHEWICGHRDLDDVPRDQWLEHIAFRETKPPSASCAGVPPEVDAVFRRALAKSVESRYRSMHELADDLEAVLSESPLPHATAARGERFRSFMRRRRRSAAVILMVACGLFLVWTSGQSRVREQIAASVRDIKAKALSGRVDDTLTAFRDARKRFGDRNEFRLRCEEMSSELSATIRRSSLRHTAFLIPGADGAIALGDLAEDAGYLMTLVRRSDLAFVVGLEKVFRDPQSALDFVDREAKGLRSSLLHDLRILALIETNRLGEAAAAVDAAQAGSWQDLELDPMCFRAYRQLRLLEAFRLSRPNQLPPGGDAKSMVARLEPLASAVGANRGLLRATLGLVRMAAGQFLEASAEFERLSKNASYEEARIALLHQALCLSLHDPTANGFELARRVADEANPDLSAYLWLSRESAGRASESSVVAERWFLLGGPSWREHTWSGPRERERAIVFGHALMIHAVVAGKASSLRPIGGVMRSERRSGLEAAGRSALDEIRRLYCWTGVWEAEAARRSGEVSQVEDAVNFTHEWVAEFIADGGGSDFELRAAAAIANAERGLLLQEVELCAAAIEALEALVMEVDRSSVGEEEASGFEQTRALLSSRLDALQTIVN